MTISNTWRLFIFGWVISGLIGQSGSAEPRKPLLMEGKKTIHERVLTRPGAKVFDQPDGVQGAANPAFTRYYVYSRKNTGNGEWLEVGPDSRGNLAGWIRSDTTVPWKQQISLVFSNPAGRERALLFKDRKDLENIVVNGTAKREAASIRNTLKSGGQDPRIVSIEPEVPADINKNFYLLPILQTGKVLTDNGTVTLLEVASVSQTDGVNGTAAGNDQGQDPGGATLREFKAAVVFVIDSTISMGPYIDRVKEAVRRIYAKIETEGMLKKVKFGLIAYRSSILAVPGLEYLTKTFVDPSDVKDGQDFLTKVDDLKPASVSSSGGFDEDTYAGVMAALNDVKWTEYGGRYVILITDAGAIEAEEDLSATKLGAKQVQQEAKYRGVALYTLHLKTPLGAKNHAQAESQYQVLSNFLSLNKMLYYPVDLGSVETFGEIVDNLSDSIVSQVKDASKGKTVVGSAKTADADFGREEAPVTQVEKLREDTKLIGYAMQLAYLGRETGSRVPPVIQAWIADSALEDPRIKPTEVRVLLTKNQLSDTQLVVQEIVSAMQEGMISPDKFFDNLRMAALKIRVDANQIKESENAKIADTGLLGEYMEDLPYRGEILDLDEDTWKTYKAQQQEELIIDLQRKLKYYQFYNADADRWISLAEGSDPGDHVYPVPIEMLP